MQKKHKSNKSTANFSKLQKYIIASLSILILGLVAAVSLMYFASPASIRNPKLEHYHFRMQILVDGKAENFGLESYQTGYSKDQCNSALPEQPIHFHDGKDQLTHIHWKGMTGGMVMKYYGWNFIDGLPNMLGFKLNNLRDVQPVTIHGDYLPKIAKGDKFYVYTGNENGYTERTFDDWKNLDLEKFFGTTSSFTSYYKKTSEPDLLSWLIPKAMAHGTANDEDGDDGHTVPEAPEQKLIRINNLIGNVVIFVQQNKPSDQEIKDRFNMLEPLTDSTCGG